MTSNLFKLSLLSLAVSSPFCWATAASQARELSTMAEAPAVSYTCEMEVGREGQVLQETTMSATLLLDQDGDAMTMKLAQTDATFEVLVQFYKSVIEDNGIANQRVQIAVNNLKTGEQEDYISTKIKPLLYVTELNGTFKDQNNNVQNFDSLTLQCAPN